MSRRLSVLALILAITPSLAVAQTVTGDKSKDTESNGSLELFWTDLASHDAARAYRAIWSMTFTPDPSIAFMGKRLKPVVAPDPKHVAYLIGQLDKDTFTVREAATKELKSLAELAEAQISRTYEKKDLSLEHRRRLADLLEHLKPQVASTTQLQQLRAVEALELMSTDNALKFLNRLAQGAPEARLTKHAQISAKRLAVKLQPVVEKPPEQGAKRKADEPSRTLKAKKLATLRGHTDWVFAVAFSADGRTVASASAGADGTIKLWDKASGKERMTLPGRNRGIGAVVFSPDSENLAAADWNGMIHLHAVETGKVRAAFEGHSRAVWSLAFSPDGRTVASGSDDGTIKLWEVLTGKERATLPAHDREKTGRIAFSPDGKTLASGSIDQTIKLWDLPSGRQPVTMRAESLILCLTFTPDGRRLASGSFDGIASLWEVTTGKERRFVNKGPFAQLTFDPSRDGRLPKQPSPPQAVRMNATSLAVSPDGKTLVWGDNGGATKLWDLPSGKERDVFQWRHPACISVAISADGRTLASVDIENVIMLWDLSAINGPDKLEKKKDQ